MFSIFYKYDDACQFVDVSTNIDVLIIAIRLVLS